MSSDGITPQLTAAVARHLGAPARIHNLQRLSGGANKATWSFEAEIGGTRVRLVMQILSGLVQESPTQAAQGENWIAAQTEARLMMAAVKAGVPAPQVRAVLDEKDGLGPGYITQWIDGEALGPRIVRDEKLAAARTLMTAQCGKILATIHTIDRAEAVGLKSLAQAELLLTLRQIVDSYHFHLPALEFGLRWIEEHLPQETRYTVVHGDFRLGNLIVDETDGIRCILDWELSHFGDPMEDLGWLCIRTWRFGGQLPVAGVGSREDLIAAYQEASGHTVDSGAVRFWEAFGCVKWAVNCLQMGARGREEAEMERCVIGRRLEEPLWDFLNLIEKCD